MAPSTSDLARLRRMVSEPSEDTYTDELLTEYLQLWPLVDNNGRDYNNENWTEGYDLFAAAADIWDEKAALIYNKHDFTADGASFSSNQMFENAKALANHFRSLQKAKVKRAPVVGRNTYFPSYANPIFDEDEPPDFVDSIV